VPTTQIPDYLTDPHTLTNRQLAAVLRDPRNTGTPALRAAHHLIAATDAARAEHMREFFQIHGADTDSDQRLLVVEVDFDTLANLEELWDGCRDRDGQMWAALFARSLADGELGADLTRTGHLPEAIAQALAEAMLILAGAQDTFRVERTDQEPPF